MYLYKDIDNLFPFQKERSDKFNRFSATTPPLLVTITIETLGECGEK